MSSGFVYNVSPDPFIEDAGRFGTWKFPGKPEGAEYSVTEVPDYHFKHDRGDDQFEMRKQDGYDMAVDLVSKNEGFGCFAKPKGELPTAEDIQKAKDLLERHDRELILRASAIWESTHDHKLINGNARDAARRRGHKVEWALDDSSFSVIQCPFCRENIKRGSLKCMRCGEFLIDELNPKLKVIGWSPEKAIPVIVPTVSAVPEDAPFAVTKVSASK